MRSYRAPLNDMRFVLDELAGLAEVGKLPGYEEATPDTVEAILEQAAKFAAEVLDPLNAIGDREGSRRLDDGTVKTPAGFRDAYFQFIEHGWNGLTKNPDYGGQGLPQLVATAVEEMWKSANLAFAGCPLLTQGAIEAIELVGSQAQKAKFLPKMVEGVWTGTMNLTEPQAGSDLAAVRTRAVPQPDGSYKLYGQKIFITYGEHDYTENIVHLVLARAPQAPDAQYNIGQSYYQQSKYPEARDAYQRVVTDYVQIAQPSTLADAYYKLGMTYERLNQIDAAKQTYQAVVQKYPTTSSATLANSALQRLNRR